jgi:hypothetical protein
LRSEARNQLSAHHVTKLVVLTLEKSESITYGMTEKDSAHQRDRRSFMKKSLTLRQLDIFMSIQCVESVKIKIDRSHDHAIMLTSLQQFGTFGPERCSLAFVDLLFRVRRIAKRGKVFPAPCWSGLIRIHIINDQLRRNQASVPGPPM